MKRSDFDNPLQMAQHCHDLYEKLRQAKRMLLRVDIKNDNANQVRYKATAQWLDSAIEELTFEKESPS